MMQLKAEVVRRGWVHRHSGIDYFAYRKGLYPEIPPLAVGRLAWDNWLVIEARRRGGAVVDATDAVFAVHQNHDYNHHSGGYEAVWNGVEAKENRRLAGLPSGKPGWIQNAASWRMLPGKMIPAAKAPEADEVAKASSDWTDIAGQATTLIEKGRAKQALKLLDPAEPVARTYEEYHYMRAIARAQSGNTAGAVQSCQEALRINPGSAPVRELLKAMGVEAKTTWSSSGGGARKNQTLTEPRTPLPEKRALREEMRVGMEALSTDPRAAIDRLDSAMAGIYERVNATATSQTRSTNTLGSAGR